MNAILLLTTGVVIASMASQWFMARRRMTGAFVTNAVSAALALVSNTVLFFYHPDDYGVLVYHFSSMWQLACSYRGLFGVSLRRGNETGERHED